MINKGMFISLQNCRNILTLLTYNLSIFRHIHRVCSSYAINNCYGEGEYKQAGSIKG